MKCSIEISYYPLNDGYKPLIKKFIKDLMSHDELKVEPGSISTRVFGEFRPMMAILTDCMERTFETPGNVFVIKLLSADRDKEIHLG